MEFKFNYDYEDDVLSIYNYESPPKESVEVSEDIIIDLDKDDKVIGIEIFYASEFFNAFNKRIDKEFLKSLESASLEYKEFRNNWYIVVTLKSKDTIISQPMPPLRKSEYISPLIASAIQSV